MASRSNTRPPSSSPSLARSWRSWSNRSWRSPFRGCSGERCAGPTGAADLLADDPVFPGALGAKEVLVGSLEERERVVLLGSVRRDTGADRQRLGRHAVRLVSVRAVADFGEHPLGHRAGGVEVPFRDNDAELVAAVADHHVGLAAVALDEVGEMSEDAVTDAMAVVVVDHFEVVEVEHDQGKRCFAPGGAAQLALQALLEEPVVVEAGETVGQGLLLAGHQPLEHHETVDSLSGEHGQQVKVRLRITTWLGGVDAERAAGPLLLEKGRNRDRALHILPVEQILGPGALRSVGNRERPPRLQYEITHLDEQPPQVPSTGRLRSRICV